MILKASYVGSVAARLDPTYATTCGVRRFLMRRWLRRYLSRDRGKPKSPLAPLFQRGEQEIQQGGEKHKIATSLRSSQ